MRYDIDGKIIRSENAAKTHHQMSQVVVKYLKNIGRFDRILDYGCGKLRYFDTLMNVGNKVVFLDSETQITRGQKIKGEYTTIKDFLASYDRASVMLPKEVKDTSQKFDLIVCINVLSAIPCELKMSELFENIKILLSEDGRAIFVNQHYCSSFSKFKKGEKHYFGYLYKGLRGFSYYGLMDKKLVVNLLESAGFNSVEGKNFKDINIVEGYVLKSPETSGCQPR